MKTFFTKIHYKKNLDILEILLVTSLLPASFAYLITSNLRTFLYKNKILKSYKPKAFTISVGNITTGGTGKTPITAAIANYLTQNGYKVAILSRGYGSKLNSKQVNIISDGKTIYYDAQTGGDEPVWLAENCPKTIVLTSSNRVKIAKYAQEIFNCNALILDDGFQHLKLERDINIIVVDSVKQFGNKHVLPAGPLRESIKNISRANKIVVVNKGNIEKIDNLNLQNYLICNLTTDFIYEIHSNLELNHKDKTALAFSAIGQPQQFYKLIKEYGLNLIKTIDFADHHSYCIEDLNKIKATAKEIGAEILITTEKDAVKIKHLDNSNIYALKLKSTLNIKELLNL